MELKHTKGEWTPAMVENKDGSLWLGVMLDTNIAGKLGLSVLVSNEKNMVETDVANARLIAAAPEMLDLLINAIVNQKSLVDAGNFLQKEKEPLNWVNEINQDIRSIVEKATGITIEEVLS